MKIKRICAIFAALTLVIAGLVSCNPTPEAPQLPEFDPINTDWRPNQMNVNLTSETLFVQKVENLPDDFIFGMDASCVPALEKSGVTYTDFDGQVKDVYEILSNNGINYIRVRIWNDPFTADGKGYGGGNCDLENAIEVGKRATKYGMKLLVNFHYSDFWADPAKQMVPKAWKGMDIDAKSEALYQYTKDCLTALVDAGVDIGMVQVGNETNGAMCGENASSLGGWKRITQLMSARGLPECADRHSLCKPRKGGELRQLQCKSGLLRRGLRRVRLFVLPLLARHAGKLG